VCTASWLTRRDGFELFFNRDESQRRGRARPPERLELGGVRALAPVDADAGGTWIGVNEFGLALGLLNAWEAETPRAPRSRGLLVRELLGARGAEEALARLAREPLERYRAFTLALLEPGRAPALRAWDGRALAAPAARLPLSSSSLDHARAQAERERVLARALAAGGASERELLEGFQRSHEPERGPWSPCMHRADAATVSASQVRVEARTVALRYAGGPPCTTEFGDWLELERA
jgi:hypothetical protein